MDKDKKILKLTSILNEWLKYAKLWSNVKVELYTKSDVEMVKVIYFNQKIEKFMDNIGYESIEFPMTDIDKRIEHYENKVKYLSEKLDIIK